MHQVGRQIVKWKIFLTGYTNMHNLGTLVMHAALALAFMSKRRRPKAEQSVKIISCVLSKQPMEINLT